MSLTYSLSCALRVYPGSQAARITSRRMSTSRRRIAYRHHRRKQRLREPTLRRPLSFSIVLCAYPGSLAPLALHPAEHITPAGELLTDTAAASYGSAVPRLRRPLSVVLCVCPGSPAPLAQHPAGCPPPAGGSFIPPQATTTQANVTCHPHASTRKAKYLWVRPILRGSHPAGLGGGGLSGRICISPTAWGEPRPNQYRNAPPRSGGRSPTSITHGSPAYNPQPRRRASAFREAGRCSATRRSTHTPQLGRRTILPV